MANMLVVGGAGGVGSALVDKLLARGDQVAATVLNAAEAERVRARTGGRAAVHEADLGDADAALSSFREVVAGLPGLDGAAVCAAVGPNGPVEITSLADFRRTLEINCIADVAVYQAALPALRRSKGAMVFISSTSGRMGMPFVGAYTASKYALEGIVDVMRREAATQGVRISLVEPGGIRTSMIRDQLATGMTRLAALHPEHQARYGHLYRRFEVVAGGALETSASTPEQVADVLITALDAPDPEPRYIAGEDAREMLKLFGAMSDRELDAALAGMFSENPAQATGWAAETSGSA